MGAMSVEKHVVENDLIESIKIHDFYYDYSDDHSVWKRGKATESSLKLSMNACEYMLGRKEMVKIYNKHASIKIKE